MPLGKPGKAKRLAACLPHLPSQETPTGQSTAGFPPENGKGPLGCVTSRPKNMIQSQRYLFLSLTLPVSLEEAPSCRSEVVRSRRPWLARTLAAATAVAVLLVASVSLVWAEVRVEVSGVVRDVSGGVVAGVTLEALVGEQIIARVTTGANGAYELQVPARTPDTHSERAAVVLLMMSPHWTVRMRTYHMM